MGVCVEMVEVCGFLCYNYVILRFAGKCSVTFNNYYCEGGQTMNVNLVCNL